MNKLTKVTWGIEETIFMFSQWVEHPKKIKYGISIIFIKKSTLSFNSIFKYWSISFQCLWYYSICSIYLSFITFVVYFKIFDGMGIASQLPYILHVRSHVMNFFTCRRKSSETIMPRPHIMQSCADIICTDNNVLGIYLVEEKQRSTCSTYLMGKQELYP